jgi:Sulfotransferase domain
MQRDWYIVLGPAKTGTTVVARTLVNAVRPDGFSMEPASRQELEALCGTKRIAVKIIFDTWREQLSDLTAICAGNEQAGIPTTICLIRDPRDELVSRLHYFAYSFFATRPTTDEQRTSWITTFQNKEADPDGVSALEMEEELWRTFGEGFRPPQELHRSYLQFVEDLRALPANKCHVLRYEDFIDRHIPPDLKGLLLGPQLVHPLEQRVHRSGSKGAWNRFFTDRDTEFYNQYFEQYLITFGYPLARNAEIGPAISSGIGSAYVARLIDEARATYAQAAQQKSRTTDPRLAVYTPGGISTGTGHSTVRGAKVRGGQASAENGTESSESRGL